MPPATPWFRRRYAVPQEHGSWAWWIGPFVVGLAAGGRPDADGVALGTGLLAGFLLHQPAALAVKAATGRGPRADLGPALAWIVLYAVVGALCAACLVANGHALVLGLLGPGAVVFAWHLALVARRAERRRMDVEVLGAGVLALAAPAAYWTAGGTAYPEPWVLWSLCWIQSAGSIATVYLRLAQRAWDGVPPARARRAAGRATTRTHLLGLAAGAAFASVGHAPWAVLLPLGAVLADALDATWRPRPGVRARDVGLRQLAVTTVFVGLMILAWR